ncbi:MULTISPECIES: acyltransferase family protein [unclassified Brevundimonas]|uniref:acyltransferase family protein n=2 Tax=Brevundimonas TaxID=41275 RepID=UPI0025B8C8B9|nr:MULTISPECIES: acyltransferase [unclassified Brevundimonas]
MGERFYGVQALRFAAATAVVAAHAVDLAGKRLGLETLAGDGPLADFGAVGVDLFFVISGFVIATTTRGRSGLAAAGEFLWRRCRRVAPIYWLVSLPILIGMARGGTLSAEVAAATFLFWPFSGLEMTFPALGPGWTLCFEMLFYAAFGLSLAGGRRVGWGLAGAYAVLIVGGFFAAAPVLRFWGAPIILEFLLGVVIARTWRSAPRWAGPWAMGLGLAGLGLTLAFGYGRIDGVEALNDPATGMARVLIWGLPSALVVFGAVRLERLDRAPGGLGRAAAFMGDASYSIYLIHVLVIRGLGRLFETGMVALAGDAVVVLTVAASLAAGAVVHVWIERPLLTVMTPSPAARGLERPRA